MTLFLYIYWLLRKSILNLANRIFADPRHVRGRKSSSGEFETIIIKKALIHCGALTTKEHFGQIL